MQINNLKIFNNKAIFERLLKIENYANFDRLKILFKVYS